MAARDFEECIREAMAAGKVSNRRGEQLIKKYHKAVGDFKAQGNKKAAEAAQKLLDSEIAESARKRRDLIATALKQEEILEQIVNTPHGTLFEKIRKVYQKAAFRGERVEAATLRHLNEVADKLKVNLLGTNRDHDFFKLAVKELIDPGTIDDPDAKKLADALRQTFQYSRARFVAAGGHLGKIENYFPQVHQRESYRAIVKAHQKRLVAEGLTEKKAAKKAVELAKDEYVKFMVPRLDKRKMIDKTTGMEFASDEDVASMLGDIFEEIYFEGRRGTKGKGEINTRHSQPRVLHFLDSDAFFEFNAKYGVGDKGLSKLYIDHISKMAKDTGILEVLGPRPNAIKNYLDDLLRRQEHTSTKIERDSQILRGEFNVLTSRLATGDVDNGIYKLLGAAQNIVRSALLGSASVSALSDVAFAHATMQLNGLSTQKMMRHFMEAIAKTGDAQKFAKRMGHIGDLFNMQALSDSRQTGEALGSGVTAWMAKLTNQASGLDRWTKSVKMAVSMEAVTALGDFIDNRTAWDKLDINLRDNLVANGIDEAKWKFTLKNADIGEINGMKIFIPSEFRAKQFSKKDDGLIAAAIADSYDDWIAQLRQQATNEATLQTRALTSGAALGEGLGGKGTLFNMATTSLGMFKTFPITVFNTHFREISRQARRGRYGTAASQALSTIGMTWVLGTAIYQAKQMIVGKSPQDWDNPRTWMAGLIQGGGAGYIGDLIFAQGGKSRYGRSVVEEMAGPMAGLLSDSVSVVDDIPSRLIDAIFGKKDPFGDSTMGRDLFRMIKRNVPIVSSLWYTRLVWERLLMDHLERLVDPKFDDRIRQQERRMRKDLGQRYWWRPGGRPNP